MQVKFIWRVKNNLYIKPLELKLNLKKIKNLKERKKTRIFMHFYLCLNIIF